MKRVERHHWEAAQAWKKMPGNDLEAAKELVRAWNSGLGLEESCTYVKYPATNEFAQALAAIIGLARNSGNPTIVEDGEGDLLCDACLKKRCRRR